MRALSSNTGPEARRDAIVRLIRDNEIATQDELRRRLAKEGLVVNQATLSRDLAHLGARRVADREGGTVYEITGRALFESEGAVTSLKALVLRVEDNGSLVVVRTLPGAASAIAAAIDEAQLPEVLGTLAGDDTIFLAPAKRTSAAGAARKLRTLWETA
ncbi:MAG: arginine repressor [Myxococcaceae bacterium]